MVQSTCMVLCTYIEFLRRSNTLSFEEVEVREVIYVLEFQYHQVNYSSVNSILPHHGAYASTTTALPSIGLNRSSLILVSFNCCNELKRVDVDVGETCRDLLKSIDDDVEEIRTGGLSLYDENASVYKDIHDTSSIIANIIILMLNYGSREETNS